MQLHTNYFLKTDSRGNNHEIIYSTSYSKGSKNLVDKKGLIHFENENKLIGELIYSPNISFEKSTREFEYKSKKYILEWLINNSRKDHFIDQNTAIRIAFKQKYGASPSNSFIKNHYKTVE